MSGTSPLDAKEQVRQAVDIVELVEQYARLRRQGRNYVGLCPWHDDTRPSLQVNPERQSWKCWVCDVGGDVFSFVMKMEGVGFREALEMLAERVGVELKPVRKQAVEPGGPADKRTLYQAMAWAEEQYHRCLLDAPEAEPARRYLDERGVTAESIARFRLGFAPHERGWLIGRAGADPRRTRILEAVGILAGSEATGNRYDRFRGRLLFSIRDAQGRPVGFGGRVLPGDDLVGPAKYVNSPETPLFRKSETLYALDLAKEAIRRSKPKTVLVMEGYTDVIAAHQAGFENAVAVLGTALGEAHVRLLKRFADRIVLVLDGDEAGQRRAGEVLELFVAQQVDLHVVTLPEGSDPADFLHEHGPEAFADLIETRALGALDHAFAAATRKLDIEHDLSGADRALEQLLSVMARAPRLGSATDAQRQAREWRLLGALALKFRMPEETIRARLRELRRRLTRRVSKASAGGGSGAGPGEAAATAAGAPLEPAARECLELFICHPECIELARKQLAPEAIASAPGREIYKTMCRLSDAGDSPTFERLLLALDDPGLKSLLVELDERGQAKGFDDPENRLQKLIEALRRREAEKLHRAQTSALREGTLSEEEAARVASQIVQSQIVQQRRGSSEPTDG